MFRTSPFARAGVVTAAAAAVITCAGPAFAGPAPSSRADGMQISLSPAHSLPGVPESRAYFIRSVRAGASFTDAVVVHNLGASSATLSVRPVDGVTAQATGAVYSTGKTMRDGQWVSVASQVVTVPPRQSIAVPFTVHVPKGARAGQHLAGIAFVPNTPNVAQRGALSIRTFYRTVMGVLVTVPGPAAPHVAFSHVTIGTGGFSGLASVNVGFHNTGNLLIRPRLTVLLTRGSYRQQVVKQLGTVLPADDVNYQVSWPTALASGTYDITASLATPGMQTVVYRTTSALGQDIAGGANAPLRPFLLPTAGHTRTISVAMLAAAMVATVLLGAVGTWWMVVVRRRRRAAAADALAREAASLSVGDSQPVCVR